MVVGESVGFAIVLEEEGPLRGGGIDGEDSSVGNVG